MDGTEALHTRLSPEGVTVVGVFLAWDAAGWVSTSFAVTGGDTARVTSRPPSGLRRCQASARCAARRVILRLMAVALGVLLVGSAGASVVGTIVVPCALRSRLTMRVRIGR